MADKKPCDCPVCNLSDDIVDICSKYGECGLDSFKVMQVMARVTGRMVHLLMQSDTVPGYAVFDAFQENFVQGQLEMIPKLDERIHDTKGNA